MSKIKVATCVPRQYWMRQEKWKWLSEAIKRTDCDILLLSQEFFGGGSCREICRLRGQQTDDQPVTVDYLSENIANLGATCHIGIGATVDHEACRSEDYLYFRPDGTLLGYHSKIALPVQDSTLTNGASKVLPEHDFKRATTPVVIPDLGLRVGTVFCWQVFFNDFWAEMAHNKCSLIVHPIKFAPRAWYKKGQNQAGEETRVGFTQESGSDDPSSDALGWIRKLKAESEFRDLPIAVTCNTWSGGEKYLALVGFVDEVTGHTNLEHVPSTETAERVIIHEYDPSLYNEIGHLSLGVYAQYKDDWPRLMQGTMRRKAQRIEQRAKAGQSFVELQPNIFEQPE